MSVYKKLGEAREKFHQLSLKKTGFNKFASYSYFEISDFIIPALSIFQQVGLVGYISFGSELASLTIVDVEQPDDKLVITSPMSTCEMKGLHEVQRLGAVQTYLRRYLWVAALEIVEHDAIDSSDGAEDKKAKKIIHTPTAGAMDNIHPEERLYLQELALEAIAAVAAGTPRVAYERIEADKLESDQKVALWTLLDSKTRSAIKLAATVPL